MTLLRLTYLDGSATTRMVEACTLTWSNDLHSVTITDTDGRLAEVTIAKHTSPKALMVVKP